MVDREKMSFSKQDFQNELKDDLRKAILDRYESKEECLNELRRYKKAFKFDRAYNYYKYGNIFPYYSQIEKFYINHFVDIPEDCKKLQEMFEDDLREVIDNLIEENQRYDEY